MLFTSIDNFNEYSDANSGIKFLAIKPSIEHAEMKFITPIFGDSFINYLLGKETANTNTPIEENLLSAIRYALASCSLYEYSFIAEVQLTDKGVRRGNSEQQPGAFKYQVQEYRKSVLDRAFLYMEKAISLAETMLVTGSEANAWKNSAEFQDYRKLLIKSGTEFQKILSQIRYPRRLFMLLQTQILNVQELTIKKAISAPIYAEILTKLQNADPEFDAHHIALLEPLKKAIAHLAFARGISAIVADMDENGIHVLSNNSDMSSSVGKKTAASENIINTIIKHNDSAGMAWLEKAIEVINELSSETIWSDWYNKKQASLNQPDNSALLVGCLGL